MVAILNQNLLNEYEWLKHVSYFQQQKEMFFQTLVLFVPKKIFNGIYRAVIMFPSGHEKQSLMFLKDCASLLWMQRVTCVYN